MTEEEEEKLDSDYLFRIQPMLYAPFQMIFLWWCVSTVSVWELTNMEIVYFGLSYINLWYFL